MSVALSVFLTACDNHPKKSKIGVRQSRRMLVMDDFESGALTDWKIVGAGAGGWFVYTNGRKAPDPARSDPNAPFDVPIRPRAGSRR